MDRADEALSGWAAELVDAYKIDEVPKGWLTVAELMAKSGLPENSLKSKLARLERDGKIHKKGFKIKLGGSCRMVNHYGEK